MKVRFGNRYLDYHDLMVMTEIMVSEMAKAVTGSYKFSWTDGDGKEIQVDCTPPFKRVSMVLGCDIVMAHIVIQATVDGTRLRYSYGPYSHSSECRWYSAAIQPLESDRRDREVALRCLGWRRSWE